MNLTLGFSPCPNDTFIFDAMVNQKIDTDGLEFDAVLEDVETLNQWALEGKLAITKLSFPAFFQSINRYILLNSGSALGKGVGPLLISKTPFPGSPEKNFIEKVSASSIAIPGLHTTANLLLSFAFPEAKRKIPFLFSEIEDAVLEEKTEMGVIIHENRFTYWKRGLQKVLDLGEFWESKMNVPIPLGGIAIRRDMHPSLTKRVDAVIRKSLDYAFANYPAVSDYVKEYSQSMSEEVMRQHIDLYVNNYSLDLGAEGRNAIIALKNCFEGIRKGEKIPDSTMLFL